jgi:hypothetical protein
MSSLHAAKAASFHPLRWLLALLLIVLPTVFLVPAAPARAAGIVVDPGGGGNYTTIQAAINNAAPGDTVLIRSGTYNENLDLTLMGSAIGGARGNLTLYAVDGPGTVSLVGSGVKLRNSGAYNGHLLIDGVRFSSTDNDAVLLTAFTGLTIANSTFASIGSTFDHDGLQITVSSGQPSIAIINSTFQDVFDYQTRIAIDGTAQARVSIVDSTFTDTGAANQSYQGVFVRASDSASADVTVANNSVSGLRGTAIDLGSQNSATLRGYAVNNTVSAAASAGTAIQAALLGSSTTNNITIADNTVASGNNAGATIYVYDAGSGGGTVQVLRNTVSNVGTSNERGIYVDSDSATNGGDLKARVDGNQISNTAGSGIYVRTQGASVANVEAIITNNTISNINIGGFGSEAGLRVRNGFVSGAAMNTFLRAAGNDFNDASIRLEDDAANAGSLRVEYDGSNLTSGLQSLNTDLDTVTTVNSIGQIAVNSLIAPMENRAPAASADTGSTATAAATNIDVLANDSAVDSDSKLLAGFTPVSMRGGTVTRNTNGTAGDLSDDQLTYTSLAGFSGTDDFYYVLSDASGASDVQKVTITVVSDSIPPDTGIVSGPPTLTNSSSATFDFSGTDNIGVTGFECKLDTAPTFTSCTDPVTFTGLSNGDHTLEVRARDAAGNVDPTPASYAWTVDTIAPTTMIESAPPTVTNSTSATFDFSGTDNVSVAGFECKLDSAPTFTPCTDPVTFTGLSSGGHTLEVRARDTAGNVDATPASYGWTIDTTNPAAPEFTSITDDNGTSANDEITNDPTLLINGTAEADSTVTVSRSGVGVIGSPVANASGNWSLDYTGTTLATGVYTFTATATDVAGNVSVGSADFVVQVDRAVPTVSVERATGQSDPAASGPIVFSVTFSEPVSGLTASDFSVGGTAGATSGALSGSGSVYTLTVSAMTQAGTVTASLPAGQAIDVAGNLNSASTSSDNSVLFDPPAPALISVVRANSDPSNAATVGYTVTFNTSVTGVDTGDFSLSTTGGQAGATIGAISGSGAIWVVNVSTVNAAVGTITLNVLDDDSIVNGFAVPLGGAGDNGGLNGGADQTYTIDRVAPGLVLNTSASNPTNASPFAVTAEFSEDVSGFTAGDVVVTNGTVSNFIAIDGDSYTFDITPSADGLVTVSVAAGVASDSAGNANTAASDLTRTYDGTLPSVMLSTSASEPTNASPFVVTAQFSEDVSGFVAADVVVTNGTLSNFTVVDDDNYTFEITPSADGLVTVSVAAGVASDPAGNPNTAASDLTRIFDGREPSVSLSTSVSEPTNASPFVVTAEFSEDVSGFTAGDVVVTNGTLSNFTAVDGDRYTFDITPSGDGVVTVSVAAGMASDAAGNANTAATTLTRTFDSTAPTVIIEQSASQLDPTSRGPIIFSVEFSEDVTGFDATDLDFSASSVPGVLTATVSGGPRLYTLDVSGMLGGGDVVVSVAAAAAQDAAGNDSATSTSADNRVTFTPPPPALLAIERAGPSPTNAATVVYSVTFDLAVSGVDASDFRLDTSGGQTSAVIADVSDSGDGATWLVSVSTVADAEGNITLSLLDDDSIVSNQNAPLGGSGDNASFNGGADQTYIVDRVAPTPTISQADGQDDPSTTAPLQFRVSFDEDVSDFTAADVVIGDDAPGSLSAVVSGGPANYIVTVSGMTGGGTVSITLLPGAALDSVGNSSVAANITDNVIIFAPALPVATGSTRVDASPTNAASVRFRVTFSEDVVGVESGDFTLDSSGISGAAVTDVVGAGTAYTVTVSTGSGSGELQLDVVDDDSITSAAAGIALGGAGTGNGTFSAGEVYQIDRIAPLALDLSEPVIIDGSTELFSFTLTYSDNLALATDSLGDDDLVLSGPNGFSTPVQLISVTPAGNGTPRTASYTANVPGGSLDAADNGDYTLTIVEDSIFDTAGNAASGVAGVFNINIEPEPRYTLYLPIVRAAQPVSRPDLVVESIAVVDGSLLVTILNQGNAAVTRAFWVDLYANPTTAPTAPNQTWPMLGDHGALWGVEGDVLPIAAGERVTLTIGDAYFNASQSNLPSTLPAGTRIYAQVDSANTETAYGAVLEADELPGATYNNVAMIQLLQALQIASHDSAVAAPNSAALPRRAR